MGDKVAGRGFVWYGLRISFWIVVSFFVILLVLDFFKYYTSGFFTILLLVWFVLVIFTFIISIVHLVRYKNKTFAVVVLIISFLLILWVVSGAVSGLRNMGAASSAVGRCSSFCSEFGEMAIPSIVFNNESGGFECYCYDDDSKLLGSVVVSFDG